jgi:hypothetical protein
MTYNVFNWDYPNLSYSDIVGPHRGVTYYNLLIDKRTGETVKGIIDNDRWVVCQLSGDDNWWIVPLYEESEALVDDIGPFDTMEEALIHMKLCSTKIE